MRSSELQAQLRGCTRPARSWAPERLIVASERLLDDSARDQCRRNLNADCYRGSEIDDQVDFRGLLDWQIGRLITLEYPARVDAEPTERARKPSSVAHSPPAADSRNPEWPVVCDRW